MNDDNLQGWDSGRHPVNVLHLVMGLAFLGMAAIWWLIANDVVADDEIRWLLPLPWVVAGLGGLGALAFGGVRRHGTVSVDATNPTTQQEPVSVDGEDA